MLSQRKQLWFAWKFLSLWYQTQQSWILLLEWLCCDLLENFYLCGIKHNPNEQRTRLYGLWFAWKFLSLWYQTQLQIDYNILLTRCDLLENFYLCGIKHNTRSKMVQKFQSCDLLENFYLCGIKHNWKRYPTAFLCVVICLKISIFVVSNTTTRLFSFPFWLLWFAWKFLSLWYQTQLHYSLRQHDEGCDLLENFYLCGIKHNHPTQKPVPLLVVICLKISIFVVSNTTTTATPTTTIKLWFAWKFLSLWYQTQLSIVVSCYRISCDLLENFYLCGIKHNAA